MSEIAKYDNGSTVFAGDNVIDKNKIDKYPIVSNFGSLLTQIGDGEIVDAFFSIATGAVPTPSSELLYGNVSTDGVVDEFEGPGYVVVDNDKITVNPPGEFVWGYNSPYLQAKIVPDGIDIFNNKTNQTDCDRGKRRWHGASREPVAGVNRRPGPFASAFRASGDEPEGRAPYSAHQDGLFTGKPGGTAELSVPGIRDRRAFLFSQDLQRRRPRRHGL